jgi:hypothetical protein
MSTREVEAGVRQARGRDLRDPAVVAMEAQLREHLGARVEVKKKNGEGTITISFYSNDEFESLSERLLKG